MIKIGCLKKIKCLNLSPESIIHLTVCNCKTKCSMNRCCRKNGLLQDVWIQKNCENMKIFMENTKIIISPWWEKCLVQVELEMITNFANQLAIERMHLRMYIVANLVVFGNKMLVLKIAARLQSYLNKCYLVTKHNQWKWMNWPVLLWKVSR